MAEKFTPRKILDKYVEQPPDLFGPNPPQPIIDPRTLGHGIMEPIVVADLSLSKPGAPDQDFDDLLST